MDDRTMGQRIAEERKKLGISQEALGDKMGVSRQAISKWEADGAVPEIDKLVSLSRLFGVSVGWLLGVEEQPEKQTDELTESQLKMVEEIVRRYQPEPMEKNFPWILSAMMIGAALLIAVCIFGFVFRGSGSKDYSGQIANLEANYNSISRQLSALSGRIDSISTSVEEASSPLADYRFYLEPNYEAKSVAVSIQAVPRTLIEDGEATLHVRLDGAVYKSAPFRWDVNAYTATVEVDYDTGYEYWMVMDVGGKQESVRLVDVTAQNPQKEYAITCEITPGNCRFIPEEGILKLYDYDAYLRQPYTSAHNDEQWEYAEWVLYHIRNEKSELIHTETSLIGGDANFTECWAHLNADVTLPELQEGDRLELRYRAKLAAGLQEDGYAGGWLFSGGALTPES